MGCATRVDPSPQQLAETEGLAFSRVRTVLTGPTTRAYLPELRFLELYNRTTKERFRIDVQQADSVIYLQLPPGEYELSRIMINEGAYQSAAAPGPVFRIPQIPNGGVTYLGTWRLGVSSPRYGREVLLSFVEELDETWPIVIDRYPGLRDRPITTVLPNPVLSETSLYEVPPYPRIWFFRRHHTS